MQTKKQKGSALVYALIMLSIMIVIAAGSFSASVIDQKTSNDTTKSVTAFQAADTGVEKVLDVINAYIVNGSETATLSEAGLCIPPETTYTETSAAGVKTTVSFYKAGDILITDCSAAESTIKNLDYIKSVGEFGGTVRAVAVSVEGPDDCSGTVTHDGLEYGLVRAADDSCWLDRNLGVTVEPSTLTGYADPDGYGWYFQWGRKADGHQLSINTPSDTNRSSTNDVDDPADTGGIANNGKFIKHGITPFNWRTLLVNNLWDGVSAPNNPCPPGFRIPDVSDWQELIDPSAENITNRDSAFASSLKLTTAGLRRYDDVTAAVGTNGYYATSAVSGDPAHCLVLSLPILHLRITVPPEFPFVVLRIKQ